METTEFRPRYDELMRLINQRGFRQVLKPARKLAETSGRAEAWFLYNLAVCLTGLHGGALTGSPQLIANIKRCSDYTQRTEGDARRDRVNALLARYRTKPKVRQKIDDEIANIALLHGEDPNRLAVLTGTQGRYAYAMRQYSVAAKLHKDADDRWRDIGDDADRQWTYNNLIHWLKAEVRQNEPNSPLAAKLRGRIAEECPPGAKNRSGEANRICWPVIGNVVDDLARAYQHRLPNWLYRRLHR